MKKYIWYLAALMIVFVSCSDSEEIEMNYQANFTVRTNNVISSYKDYNHENYFHLNNKEKLRVSVFIYDSDGNLFSKNEHLLDDYNQDFNFTIKAPEGEYNILAISSVAYNSDEDFYWEYEGVDNISTFSLKQNLFHSDRATLGFAEDKMVVTNSKCDKTISLSSATALVTVTFQYWVWSYLLHQAAIEEGRTDLSYYNMYDNKFKFWYYAYNKIAKDGTGWEKSNTELKIDHQYIWFLDVDSEVEAYTSNNEPYPKGTYHNFALLPGELDYNCTYSQLMNNGSLIEDKNFSDIGSGVMKIEKGKQYMLDIACRYYVAEFGPYKENSGEEKLNLFPNKSKMINVNLINRN